MKYRMAPFIVFLWYYSWFTKTKYHSSEKKDTLEKTCFHSLEVLNLLHFLKNMIHAIDFIKPVFVWCIGRGVVWIL